jgi:hypothetical protein
LKKLIRKPSSKSSLKNKIRACNANINNINHCIQIKLNSPTHPILLFALVWCKDCSFFWDIGRVVVVHLATHSQTYDSQCYDVVESQTCWLVCLILLLK